jgi:DNA-binding winged helix-turn-helix (wHTH) protein/Tol biopolymer transport system component
MDPIESALYEFDCYQLDVNEGMLLRNGEPVNLQWKAFETLCVLVRSEGRLVSREELIETIWPDSFVEENNLSQQIRALRKLLGNGEEGVQFIETVPRRGYRFLPPVKIPSELPAGENGGTVQTGIEQPNEPANIFSGPTIKAESRAAEPAPVPVRRSFSRKALVITVFCLSIVSALGFISWRNRPRAVSDKIWNNTGAAAQTLFASAVVEQISGADDGVISPDGKRLIYTTEVAGKESMWLQQVASGRAIQIAGPQDGGYGKLLFSSDSEFVYYSTGTEKGFEVYRISMLGGDPEKLVDGIGAQFALSPENTRIAAITRDPEKKLCNLVVFDLAQKTSVPISSQSFSRCFGALAWSPNGRFIAASLGISESGASDNELVEISVDGQEMRSLTSERWAIIRDIVWRADRRSVLLAGRKKYTDFVQVWRVWRSTGEATQMSNDTSNYSTISLTDNGGTLVAKKTDIKSDLYVAPADMPDRGTALVHAFGRIAWLPDGRIVRSPYKQDELWTINPDGSGQVQIGSNYEGSVAVSPDGRHIYSVSAESGSFHIWRMGRDGSNRIQLTKTKESEQYPVVSPDNRWVYFDSISSEGTSIKRMPVSGGASHTVQGVGASRPSLSPDGQLLAFIQKNENGVGPYGIGLSFADGRNTSRIDPAGNIMGSRIEWAEDSTAIYYAAEERDSTVNIWRHPLNGEPPVKITNFSNDRIFDFLFSPDRSRIAYVRGNWTHNVVKMDFVD